MADSSFLRPYVYAWLGVSYEVAKKKPLLYTPKKSGVDPNYFCFLGEIFRMNFLFRK